MAEATEVQKFRALISKDDATKQAEQIDFAVEEALQTTNSDILATQRAIAAQKKAVAAAKSSVDFNPSRIIGEQDKLAGLEKGLAGLIALKAELFD